MDLRSLLQESPSEDHRRRQDQREREDRERERERREQERNREQWDRENELRHERESVRQPQAALRSPTRPFSPVANTASSSSTSHPPYGSFRSAARERDYDSHPPVRSYSLENTRAPPPAGPGLPPLPPSSSSRAHSPPPPASASVPGPPLFHSPLTAHREPLMMGPGAPPEGAPEYGPGARERKQNLSQPHSHSRQAVPTLGKPSSPVVPYPSREYERERERELRERDRRSVVGHGGDFNREQDRRLHTHASRSPVNTFSVVPQQQQQQQQLSPPLPQKTGSPSTSSTSASIHKSPALHNHHAHSGHGQAPGVPNTSRRPPPSQSTSVSLPLPPSVSPVSGRRALDASGAPVGGPQAPVMSSLRPYDSESNTARHGRDAPAMASVNTVTASNGRDHDRDREQRERDNAYVTGGLSIQQAQQRQRERERTLKDDIDREREFYEQQRRINRSASNGAMSTGQQTSPPMHPSMGRDIRERDYDNERIRREDMDVIRAAAANRQGHAHATQGQRERDAYHPSQSYPPQQLHPQQLHHHPSQTHSHSHPHSAHLHQQQPLPLGPPLSQQAHQHQFPLSHSQQVPQAQQKPKGAVLKLAPPGVEVSNNPPSVSTSRTDKPETLTLLPPAHAQAHAQQQQNQQQHASRSLGPEHGAATQAPPPASPTLSLRLAPDQPYINVQPSPLGHGQQAHSAHPNRHGHSSKSYSVVPTAGGPPPNAGPSSLPPAANVQDSMIAAQQARQQHEQRQRQQQEQQYGRHSHLPHRHAHEPPPPSAAAPTEMHSIHQLRHHQESHGHLRRSSIPPSSAHSLSQSHGPSPSGPPPPPGYPQHPPSNLQYSHGDPHLVPVPMSLPLPPPSPALEPFSSEPPLHLGTFIFPRTPFPYFFPAASKRLLTDQQSRRASEREAGRGHGRHEPDALSERETHVTILIPTTYLPSTRQRDGRPRIWGGGGSDRALPSGLPQDRHSFYRFTPPKLPRRIYTDDSDLVLCALHAGRISWNGIQRARAAHLDLELRLRVVRDVGQYIGGPSALARGYASSGAEQDLDLGLEQLVKSSGKISTTREIGEEASWLQSASWESGHDGSGIEVLRAEWVPRASAHSCGLRNRSQRLLEYAERRLDIMSLSSVPSAHVLGKRPMRRQESLAFDEDEQDLMSRTVVFGRWNSANSIGFKYDPTIVKFSLFPLPSTISSSDRIRKRKRRKITSNADASHIEDETDTHSDNEKPRDAMILENDEERFLFTLKTQSTTMITDEDADKENINESAPEESGKVLEKSRERKGRKYNIYVIPASVSKVKSGSAPQANGVHNKLANGDVDRDSSTPSLSEPKTSLKDLQLLYSDVDEDALDFQANGLAVLPSYILKTNAVDNPSSLERTEKGWFMRVQRWRWAGRKEGVVSS